MTIEFPDGCVKVDRTFEKMQEMFGPGPKSVVVVGSCVVDGDLMEFGVIFMSGGTTLVSAPGRSFTAREVRLSNFENDEEALKKAQQAVTDMLKFEERAYGRHLSK
jgi:Ni,Fe-hydrogenase III small subunit